MARLVGDLMTDDFGPTEWITTREAAKLTGYDPTHIRWLVRAGRVEGKKFGRDWMVKRQSIEDYAEKMRELGPARHDPWRTGARKREVKD